MVESTALPSVDREAIRSKLQSTHDAFRGLVTRIPGDRWDAKSGNPAWTCGQLAWHLSDGVVFSIGLIENARKGRQTNVPSFLMPMALKANEFNVRRKARKATRDSVLEGYSESTARLLRILDDLTDEEFAITKTNFGQARTMPEMLLVPVEHFAEHGPEIESAL